MTFAKSEIKRSSAKAAARESDKPRYDLLIAGADKRICVLDAATGQPLETLESEVSTPILAPVPKTTPIRPSDLMATVFQVLGIDPSIQFVNEAGRPVYMLEEGHPIRELV